MSTFDFVNPAGDFERVRTCYGRVPEGQVATKSVPFQELYPRVPDYQHGASREVTFTLAPDPSKIGRGVWGYRAGSRMSVGQQMNGPRGLADAAWTETDQRALDEAVRGGDKTEAHRLRLERSLYYGGKAKSWFHDLPQGSQVVIAIMAGLVLQRLVSAFKG